MTIVCSGAFSTSQLCNNDRFGCAQDGGIFWRQNFEFDYIPQSERFTTLNLHIYKQKIIVC